jgi:hypothetical protein
MSIQDFLDKYKDRKLNLTAIDLKVSSDPSSLQGINIKATNGYGVEVLITIPLKADLDNMFIEQSNRVRRNE